jgi:hypothetical protein
VADDEKIVYKVDLDVADAVNHLFGLKSEINELGEAEGPEALIKNIMKIGGAVAAAGVVVFSLKEALDFTLEAEAIQKVAAQFDFLAAKAGLASNDLKSGLEKSAKGLATTDELLQAANKALVTLGGNAKQLPAIMELARKATSVFGGDLISNFEKINQAVATGMTKQIKGIGIIVDADKANKKYAETMNIAVSALSKAEKQQAMLNAVLSQGTKAFGDSNIGADSTKNNLQRITVALKEVGEAFVLAFDKIAGPLVRAIVKSLGDMAHGFKTEVVAAIGDGSAKIEAQLESVEKRAAFLSQQLQKLKDQKAPPDAWSKNLERDLEAAEARATSLKEKLKEVKEEEAKKGPQAEGEGGPEADLEKRRAQKAKFNEELLKMEATYNEQLLSLATDEKDAIARIEYQKVLLHQQTNDEIEKLELNKDLTTTQRIQLQTRVRDQAAAKELQIEQSKDAAILKSYETLAKAGDTSFQKFSNGAHAAGLKAKKEFSDFGKFGSDTVAAFGKSTESAFLAIGEGSMSLGEAMKGALIGAIADIAQSKGSMLILSGIAELNPIEVAGGGALVALAGYLRSQVKSSSGSSMGSPPVTGSGASGTFNEGIGANQGPSNAALAPGDASFHRAVTLQVQGHYFDSTESRQVVMDMLRKESDASDFKLVQVGGGQ